MKSKHENKAELVLTVIYKAEEPDRLIKRRKPCERQLLSIDLPEALLERAGRISIISKLTNAGTRVTQEGPSAFLLLTL